LHFCRRLTRHQKHTHTHTGNKSECVTQRRKTRAITAHSQHYKNRGVFLSYLLLTEQLNRSCNTGCLKLLSRCKLLLQLRNSLHTMRAEKPARCPTLVCRATPACWTNLAATWAGKSLQTATAECHAVSAENDRQSSLRKPAESTRRRICRK